MEVDYWRLTASWAWLAAIFTAAPRHRELQVIKITGSAFADFSRDEHTLTTAELAE